MMSFNQQWLIIIILLQVSFLILFHNCSQIETNKYKIYKKNQWTKNLVSRSKRSYDETIFSNNNKHLSSQNDHLKRPCPIGCTCSYDTINCNELIDECHDCIHWHQIDFNQIAEMKKQTFKNFNFAPNRTTHIIIYKLLNSTLTENIFEDLIVPSNAQLEITFQYNSVIKLDKFTLNGIVLKSNATLVFNFPYTAQVIFVTKCFHGVHMTDSNSRLIFRILKSFSVRFISDYYSQNYLNLKTSRLNMPNSTDSSVKVKNTTSWSISTGQFIIDIKSTHLVKFEENSFSYLKLKSQAKFYLDLDIIEKLMIQRNSFSYINLGADTHLTLYTKHVTFIDFKAFSFSHISMFADSRLQIYLEELISSLCVQRNVFSYLKLKEDNSYFNFSIINSKNVMLMHDSFSNIDIDSPTARLFIGVFNSPSYQIKLKTNNFYQNFLKERLKWSTNSVNNNDYNQYTNHFAPPFPISNSEYFYNHGINSNQLTINSNSDDLKTFFINNKQTYSYNVSLERNCFSNLNLNYQEDFNENNLNIWIFVDNIKTLLVDDYIIDYFNTNSTNLINNNINFVVNVRYFVLSPNSLQNINKLRVEFLREPKIIKFGLLPKSAQTFIKKPRNIKLIGLNLNKIKPEISLNEEQENLDDPYNSLSDQSFVNIDDYCHLAFASNNDTLFSLEDRDDQMDQYCSCESIYLVLNQLKDLKTALKLLDCKVKDYEHIMNCRKQLEWECTKEETSYNLNEYKQGFLSGFIKFWDYCITEQDPLSQQIQENQAVEQNSQQKNSFFSNTDLYFNNFNDPDGMFSASLSSSSFFDQPIDYFKPPSSILTSPTQSQANSSVASNIGKIIGIVIVCFLSGIILFMIVINIIQYKFRNELLDDLDYVSQYNNNLTNNNSNNISNDDQEDSSLNQQNNDKINNLECYVDENFTAIESMQEKKKLKIDDRKKYSKSGFNTSLIIEESSLTDKYCKMNVDEPPANLYYDDEESTRSIREHDSLYDDNSSDKSLSDSVSLKKKNFSKIIKMKSSQDSGKFTELESNRTSSPPPSYENTRVV